MGISHVTYDLASGGGRLGHRTKSLLSSIILAKITGSEIVYNCTYHDKKPLCVFNEDTLSQFINESLHCDDYNVVIEEPFRGKWNGIGEEKTSQIQRRMQRTRDANDKAIYIARGGARIFPHQCKEMEEKGICRKGIADESVDLLKEMYYYQYPGELIKDTFAIHARRGDVCGIMEGIGYTRDYYEKLINQINSVSFDVGFTPKINIYTEKRGSDYIKPLGDLDNVTVHVGTEDNLHQHLSEMVRSEYIYCSWSSLCWLACILTIGSVLYDYHIIPEDGKHDLKRHDVDKINHYVPTDKDILFQGERLVETLRKNRNTETSNGLPRI
tara:strand:+ start:639 stop:1619 length:981 start_codon:yes stop_codon:yes gene_type:complete